MTLIDDFFGKEFLTLLGKRKKKSGAKSNAQQPSQRLAALGFTLAPALAKLVDFAATTTTEEVGALEMFPISDVVPNGKNALAFMLEQPFRVDAMMTHTFPLGTTGAGDLWLVSLAPARGRHDVFLYGHDSGELEHVADSLEAFALALHLRDREAPPTEAERQALAGHVANNDDIDLAWLGKKRLDKTASPTARLHEQTDELRGTLKDYGRHEPAAAGKLPARPLPAEVLDALLRTFLRCEDEALAALCGRFEQSSAGLVSDAVSHLRKLLAKKGPATFELT